MSALPDRAETVIVGGGIAGVALAHYLAAGGREDIIVVEQSSLGSGATGYSLGGVRQQYSTPLEIELAKRGLAFWKSVETVLESPCPFHKDGYLFMSGRQEILDKLAEAAALQRSLGAGPVEMLDQAQIADLLPWLGVEGIAGGCWTPDDGRVTPTDGVAALAKAARSRGVQFRESTPVARVERRAGGGFTVVGPTPVEAEQVVIACGNWTPALTAPLGYDLDVHPMLLHYALSGPALAGQHVPMTIDLDTGFCVHREGPGVVMAVLAEDLPASYSQEDMVEEFGRITEVRAPALTEVGVRTVISAEADLSADGHPYVGALEEGLWVIAGFGGHGTMHGPPVAELLANTMLGHSDPTIDMAPLDPHRSDAAAGEWLVASRKE